MTPSPSRLLPDVRREPRTLGTIDYAPSFESDAQRLSRIRKMQREQDYAAKCRTERALEEMRKEDQQLERDLNKDIDRIFGLERKAQAAETEGRLLTAELLAPAERLRRERAALKALRKKQAASVLRRRTALKWSGPELDARAGNPLKTTTKLENGRGVGAAKVERMEAALSRGEREKVGVGA